jgi:hypothetical protein
VVCFVVSELYFSYGLEHGYVSTGKSGIITKISENGRMIDEINGKPAIDEYCRLTGISKEQFLKNSFQFLLTQPLCNLDQTGNIYPNGIMVASNQPTENRFSSLQKCIEGTYFVIGRYDEKKSINSTNMAIEEACTGNKDRNAVIALNFNCATRRFLLGDKVGQELLAVQDTPSYKDLFLFGYHTFGEIGSKRNQPSRYNTFTSTCLVVFDKLMVD